MVIPKKNERDLKEIPENVREGLEIHPVQWIDEVLDHALAQPVERFSTDRAKSE